ncbi:MAG: hypothetical protein H0W72_17865, partial [Planctomycetes bacterium]|nr:hypothetical protein [Planctomycetota bacterium]
MSVTVMPGLQATSRISLVADLIVFLLAAVLLALGGAGFPLTGFDAYWFMPPALATAAGDGLVNHFYPWSPPQPLTYHGFLQAMTLASLMPRPESAGLFIALTVQHVLIVVGLHLLARRTIRGAAGWTSSLFALGLVLGVLAWALAHAGRPDGFALLIVVVACNLHLRCPRGRVAIHGIAIGALAATHPVAAAMVSAIVAAWWGWHADGRRSALALAAIAGCGLLILGLALAWYPYGIAEWLGGMVAHARRVLPG